MRSLPSQLIVTMLCLASGQAQAADLGTYGPVFPVTESSLAELMEQRFARGNEQLDDALEKAAEPFINSRLHRPNPVKGIVKATTHRRWVFKPSTMVPNNVTDAKGNILVAKGERVNPLKDKTILSALIFLDGDDLDQVEWARRHGPDLRWILTNGDPINLSSQENRPVYFDQFGWLTRRFGIKAVPALAWQDGDQIIIEEDLPC